MKRRKNFRMGTFLHQAQKQEEDDEDVPLTAMGEMKGREGKGREGKVR